MTTSAAFIAGRRLSCQTKLLGDAVIDVPPESQVHKQVVRKRAEARAIDMQPGDPPPLSSRWRSPTCTSPPPTSSASIARLRSNGVSPMSPANLAIIQQPAEDVAPRRVENHRRGLSRVRRAAAMSSRRSGRATTTAPSASPSMSARPPSRPICTDLSTGEVVASSGLMNPQIRFGEDLMSRVSYVMMNPGGEKEMTAAVREALNTLAAQVAAGSRESTERHSRGRARRQSSDASPASSASIRPSSAGRPSRSPPASR